MSEDWQLSTYALNDKIKYSERSIQDKGTDNQPIPREKWANKLEFVFACVGFAVGYGNFWRFPYKCFNNGGGAFLIPFVVCLVLAGTPLFIVELAVGQVSQCGPVQAWSLLCPLAAGIGYGMVIVCALVSVYYHVVLAWSCYYFISSFLTNIPWIPDTGNASDASVSFNRSVENSKVCGSFCSDLSSSNSSFAPNLSSLTTNSSLSHDFFVHEVLQLSPGIDATGSVVWKTALCLVLAWVLVYFCVWKGIRTTGKIVYGTATLPYLMLIVFAIQGCSLPGAGNGVQFYVTPVWEKLLEPGVWVEAASQVLYSLTLGFGVMLIFASYNEQSNNIYRDAIIISIADAATSVFSGFVVFAILGYMAELQGKDVWDASIATDGPGFVFVVYPAAMATLPQPRIWSILFFLMLITLGLDSQFGQVELICVCIIEQYPKMFRQRKELLTLLVCGVLCLGGLVCTTEGGMYWFNLLDSFAAGYSLLFLGLAELLALSWSYGAERFRDHVEDMIGFRISNFWLVMWKYVTPLICFAMLVFGLSNHSRLTYEGKYTYPLWAELLGWCLCISSIACLPLVAAIKLMKIRGSLMERISFLSSA